MMYNSTSSPAHVMLFSTLNILDNMIPAYSQNLFTIENIDKSMAWTILITIHSWR